MSVIQSAEVWVREFMGLAHTVEGGIVLCIWKTTSERMVGGDSLMANILNLER
jgi:hypothetical protein